MNLFKKLFGSSPPEESVTLTGGVNAGARPVKTEEQIAEMRRLEEEPSPAPAPPSSSSSQPISKPYSIIPIPGDANFEDSRVNVNSGQGDSSVGAAPPSGASVPQYTSAHLPKKGEITNPDEIKHPLVGLLQFKRENLGDVAEQKKFFDNILLLQQLFIDGRKPPSQDVDLKNEIEAMLHIAGTMLAAIQKNPGTDFDEEFMTAFFNEMTLNTNANERPETSVSIKRMHEVLPEQLQRGPNPVASAIFDAITDDMYPVLSEGITPKSVLTKLHACVDVILHPRPDVVEAIQQPDAVSGYVGARSYAQPGAMSPDELQQWQEFIEHVTYIYEHANFQASVPDADRPQVQAQYRASLVAIKKAIDAGLGRGVASVQYNQQLILGMFALAIQGHRAETSSYGKIVDEDFKDLVTCYRQKQAQAKEPERSVVLDEVKTVCEPPSYEEDLEDVGRTARERYWDEGYGKNVDMQLINKINLDLAEIIGAGRELPENVYAAVVAKMQTDVPSVVVEQGREMVEGVAGMPKSVAMEVEADELISGDERSSDDEPKPEPKPKPQSNYGKLTLIPIPTGPVAALVCSQECRQSRFRLINDILVDDFEQITNLVTDLNESVQALRKRITPKDVPSLALTSEILENLIIITALTEFKTNTGELLPSVALTKFLDKTENPKHATVKESFPKFMVWFTKDKSPQRELRDNFHKKLETTVKQYLSWENYTQLFACAGDVQRAKTAQSQMNTQIQQVLSSHLWENAAEKSSLKKVCEDYFSCHKSHVADTTAGLLKKIEAKKGRRRKETRTMVDRYNALHENWAKTFSSKLTADKFPVVDVVEQREDLGIGAGGIYQVSDLSRGQPAVTGIVAMVGKYPPNSVEDAGLSHSGHGYPQGGSESNGNLLSPSAVGEFGGANSPDDLEALLDFPSVPNSNGQIPSPPPAEQPGDAEQAAAEQAGLADIAQQQGGRTLSQGSSGGFSSGEDSAGSEQGLVYYNYFAKDSGLLALSRARGAVVGTAKVRVNLDSDQGAYDMNKEDYIKAPMSTIDGWKMQVIALEDEGNTVDVKIPKKAFAKILDEFTTSGNKFSLEGPNFLKLKTAVIDHLLLLIQMGYNNFSFLEAIPDNPDYNRLMPVINDIRLAFLDNWVSYFSNFGPYEDYDPELHAPNFKVVIGNKEYFLDGEESESTPQLYQDFQNTLFRDNNPEQPFYQRLHDTWFENNRTLEKLAELEQEPVNSASLSSTPATLFSLPNKNPAPMTTPAQGQQVPPWQLTK